MDLPPLKNNPTMGYQPENPSMNRKYHLRGIKDGEVVGTRIYLPNIIMRIVRNGAQPGEPYNPYRATFHVPVSVTKNDIKSYLLAIYGVETTYVNTEIPHQKGKKRGQPLHTFKPKPRFKRAIVGLVEPFYYPDDPADMSAEEFQEHEGDQVERGRTIMSKMRSFAVQRKHQKLEAPGDHEDTMLKKEQKKIEAKEKDKERRKSVTPEVISQLTSANVEQQ
jgi:large subunit ribosomal protein L23